MESLIQDVRYGFRMLRKSPGFTCMAVITLALGIGANTAVFSVMDAVLLRMLPVRDPQRLYYLQIASGNQPPGARNSGNSDTSFSATVFEALRQRNDVLDDVIAYVPLGIGKVAVRYGDMPEAAEGDEVSGNFFSGLTAGIFRGRGFSLENEKDHSQIVVISHDYWSRRFVGDSAVLGTTLFIKNVPFTIVGIASQGFRGLEPATSTDFWIPLQSRRELDAWGNSGGDDSLYSPKCWCLPLIVRLKRGVTPVQAQNALQSTFGEAAKIGVGTIDPKLWKPLLNFDPAKGIEGYNQQYREPVRILMGLVFLVLLIACSNVALLIVARNEARQREFSLRMAVGAEKGHLFRQLLTESSLLVIAGAGLGWLFALIATDALAAWSGIETGLGPDRNVLLFTLGISAISALTFGIAPLWIALRAPVSGVLRATATNITQDRHRALGGRVLMSSQVAVCMLLLVAAVLLLRTLRNYETQDLGMRADGLLVFGITPQRANSASETLTFYRALLDRIRAVPGVESATLMENRIGSGWSSNNDDDDLDGARLKGRFGSTLVRSNNVGPDYFHVLGVPLLEGRDISEADTPSSLPVVVVNETFVKKFLPNTNPLGHKFHDSRTIVGVAKDSKYRAVDETPVPMAYYPSFQRLNGGETMHVEVRVNGEPLNLLPTLRQVVHDIDPNVPLEKPMTQLAQFEESYSRPKMFARLGGFFGGLAALLVATGLYGTLSYRTNLRTAEIGTRMALGAQRRQVLWMVMRESLLISCIGTAAGLPLAVVCVRFLSSMLYELSAFDPLSFVVATGCVGLVAGVAAFLPAWHAAKVDPMVALRYE
ncbi:MAG: ABC transporter permease [Candidatus Sulfotelmatobacter sp.]|jgi:predicted permease